jgi:hypothetical protein
MDLHPPGGPVRSVKDFFVHIGVVTLGILIALGLEQLVATQALNELSFDAVTRYAQAYGTLRLFAETEREGLSIWQGVSRFGTDPTALTAAK